MHKALRRLDRLDARYGVGAPAEMRPRKSGAGFALGAVVVAGVAVGAFALVDGSTGRLADLPEVQDASGTYAFIHENVGGPVTYSPCRAIRYVVNDALAPVDARTLLNESIATISAATGLVFEDAGRTDEAADPDRSDRDVRRYGLDTSPVLIAWTTPDDVPALSGDVAGVAGSTAISVGGGPMRYVTGTVYLDAPELADIALRPGGGDAVRAIITHELGHLVGLDHVDDPSELMHAVNVGVTQLGPGDRAGLVQLGSGSCL